MCLNLRSLDVLLPSSRVYRTISGQVQRLFLDLVKLPNTGLISRGFFLFLFFPLWCHNFENWKYVVKMSRDVFFV